jgi:3-hydroxyisobutyrate dehydrogenase
MDRPTKVGFIGLGNMGQPMAARLLEAGFALTVLDADEKAQQAFVDQYGGNPASSLSALASESDAVITMLPDGQAVRRVVTSEEQDGDDRLLGSIRQGAVLIDMSSSSPTGTQALGKILAQHGIFLLDAPVSGGVSRAENGTLAIMVGGDAAVVKGCRPLLEAMGERVFETGALGSGHAMKALNNLVSAAGLIAAAEALLVGHRFGLEPTVMIDILNASTGRNNSTENKFKQHILSRAFNSGFSLDLMVKDLTTAVELARETRTPAIFSAACRELWAAALSRLENEADHTAVVRWFEEMAETELGGV